MAVYLIRDIETWNVKIGTTQNFRRRILDIHKYHYPGKTFETIVVYDHLDHTHEITIHRLLKEYRLYDEFFEFGVESLVEDIVKLIDYCQSVNLDIRAIQKNSGNEFYLDICEVPHVKRGLKKILMFSKPRKSMKVNPIIKTDYVFKEYKPKVM